MPEIERITLRRVQIPLTKPYELSHTTVDNYETIFVEVDCRDGRSGIGEATPLDGYSHDTPAECWTAAKETAGILIGRDIASVQKEWKSWTPANLFVRSAFDCAIETAIREELPSITAPVVGITSTNQSTEALLSNVEEQLSTGIRTIKVKIGFEPESDARRLAELVSVATQDVSFRVDANQGYDFGDAKSFLAEAPLHRLEHVEQPLRVGRLDEHAVLHDEYSVPIVLDEEIRRREDLDAVAESDAAAGVKFKLMKAGGWRATGEHIKAARARNLDVILGNGVQTEIGCLHEATVWDEMDVETVGEFNGWLKQDGPLLERPPDFEDGALQWSGGTLDFRSAWIDRYAIEIEEISQ